MSVSARVIRIGSILAASGVPLTANAQFSDLEDLIEGFGDIVEDLIPIVFGLIVVGFFWGLAKYVFQAQDENARDKGKRIMIGGILALFIATSIWGIIVFIQDELDLPGGEPPTIQAPTSGSGGGPPPGSSGPFPPSVPGGT